ncbi:hypothetical protein [Flavobacterium sp. Arc2]|uniref:hypothetical protein n=1 Tax=Flavobacterium sp. Arc2 TaxID=3046685 RepID=UPI00352E71AF
MKSNEKTKNEQKRIYQYLQTNTATSAMIAKALNIPQCNVCRYKAKLQKQNKLIELSKQRCRVTGYQATYLSTNVPRVNTNELKNIINAKSSNL